jgi:multiple sugar transport system permease protein
MGMFGGTSERVKLRPGKLGEAERREARIGFAFISPWIIGFLAFTLIPMIASLYFTTLDFQLATPEDARFVGLENWKRMLFDDPIIWESLAVTFKYALIALPVGLVLPIMLAILLNSKNLIGNPFSAPCFMPL